MDTAIELFFARPVTAERRAQADGKQLLEAIQDASDKQVGRDPGGEFADRVRTYWLPALAKVPTSGNSTEDDIRRGALLFEELAREIKSSGTMPTGPEVKAARNELVAALRARQTAAFPAWRRSYATRLDRRLWEQDIEVTLSGPGVRIIHFVGGRFAANANIAATQHDVAADLRLLRFAKSAYRWFPGADGWSYNLKGPSDATIGYWEGRDFVAVR